MEPVVTHAHMTTALSFREVCEAINECAFPPRIEHDAATGEPRVRPGDEHSRGVSPFPVIVSIENHCSEKVQEAMGAIQGHT